MQASPSHNLDCEGPLAPPELKTAFQLDLTKIQHPVEMVCTSSNSEEDDTDSPSEEYCIETG
jgi:hypothetical protein